MKNLRSGMLVLALSTPLLAADRPISIGAGFNLRGGLSSLAVPAANGARLAVEEINARGGLLGKNVLLFVRDSKTEPAVAARIAKQLVDGQEVDALIGWVDSDSVLAAGPAAASDGLPFITVGATSPRLPSQVGPNMFLACFGDNVQAAAGAEYAYGSLGARTAYLLYNADTEYTRLLGGYFKTRWAGLSGTSLLGEAAYPADVTSLTAQIAAIQALASPPDVLYVSANPNEIGLVVKQLRAAGLAMPILGGDGYDTPDLAAVAGVPASNDVYFTTHALVQTGASAAMDAFIAAYSKRFGRAPENAFAPLGYDTVKLLADAVKRAASRDKAAVIAALEATQSFPAITGEISYAPGNHVPKKGVTVLRLVNGAPALAAQLVPVSVPGP
jgi:branched-chain amino acid transport system substrate-binding protein